MEHPHPREERKRMNEKILSILPRKEITNACQCEKALLSWESFTNRLICHKCEKVFSERNRTIDECIAILEGKISLVPSEEEIVSSWDIVGSTHHPICKINGKLYHYMNKEELARLTREMMLGKEKT